MSDSIGSISNRPSNISDVSGADNQNRIEEDIIDKQTSKIQDELASQDNIEKLSTDKKPSKVGRIMSRIAGGILLAAGLASAATATVVSLGVAPAVIAAAATAIGGVLGTSIAAGVTGAAGIGCLVGSFVGGRSAEAFVEGQHSKHNTNDNLAMITNGKVTAKAPNTVQVETFSGLRRAFNVDDKAATYGEFEIVQKNFTIGKLITKVGCAAFSLTKLNDITYAMNVEDPNHPKLVEPDHEDALKPEYITGYVKNVINLCKGTSTEFSRENVALIRYALSYCFEHPDIMGSHANRIPAFHNESFINELSGFVQNEMNAIKNSDKEEDIENYNLMSIFKAALRLSEEDIAKLAELDKQKPAQNDDE
ncbi:hypothetical protein [Succinivibrio dextrinosolvens]|uniref:hypothetical protein n=1 Tax=Succinivibrio dextrinosolvens TaxID=83771 RepID=UPI00247960DA|nr:hypothetical protein [Succinivibrio dextrinosolvens]